jgi:hypothetical protein
MMAKTPTPADVVDRDLPTRRDLLQMAAAAMALPGAPRFFSAWFASARTVGQSGMGPMPAPPEPPLLDHYTPAFFDAEDFAALEAFTETLIPTDDTPGARDAHCAHFIDFVLQASVGVDEPTVTRWRAALRSLRAAGFHAADASGRATLVEAMSLPERDRTATHPAYAAYRLIKQQTTFAFYTSRAGIIENLDYRGARFNGSFPACEHPEHHRV